MTTKFSPQTCAIASTTLKNVNANITLSQIEKYYQEPHRHFHTCEHINQMISGLCKKDNEYPGDLSQQAFDILVLGILFHDIIYFPWKDNNENMSVSFLASVVNCDIDTIGFKACELIEATKEHKNTDYLCTILNTLDTEILRSQDMDKLIEYEHQIFKEYNFLPLDTYINKRSNFLKNYLNSKLNELANYVIHRDYKVAIYAGSFNPFHKGHFEILEKAEKLFDKVIIVKAINPAKSNINYSNTVENLESLRSREIISVSGNIIEEFMIKGSYAKYNPVLVRGLRNSSDLLYEENYLTFCKEIWPELRSCIILGSKELSHISSSAMRELTKIAPQIYEKYSVK